MSGRPLRSFPRHALVATLCTLVSLFAPARPSPAAPKRPPVAAFTIGDPAGGEICGAERALDQALARDPEMARRRATTEAIVAEAQRTGIIPNLGKGGNSTNSGPIYTIPVVVHIIHTGLNGDPENISDAQVFSQIEAVNRDLQNTLNYPPPATDCQIRLCLATKDTLGNPISGITRHLHATATIPMDQPAAEAVFKAQGYYPSKRYLNVWVVKRITVGGGGNVVGYAYFPNTAADGVDGIVMDYRFMGANNTSYGNIFSLIPTYEEGKVFPHELGHYLDVYHTFHGGCAIGDQVNDTPWEAVNFTGCVNTQPTTTCANISYPAPIHNFMDYTNDPCRWQFTPGQQQRMFAAIATYRQQLVSATNLALTLSGTCQPNVVAGITPSTRLQCNGQSINFAAANCGGGTCTYSWTFQDGTPPNATGQNVSASFSPAGPHQVTLTVSGSSSAATAVDTVFSTACTPITGPCTNWVFGNKAQLSFATGVPLAVSGTKNNGPECATQMSSSTGSLMFYTDNDTIWNASHLPMAGGGATLLRGKSSHTGALAIPRPGTTNDYYLLSVKEWEKRATTSIAPFAITRINMTGLGTITSLSTPVTLDPSNTNEPLGLVEGVTAVPQCNGNDWWVITCGADEVNAQKDWQRYLYVTPITNGGAGTTTSYPIGFFGGAGGALSPWGTLTATRDGNRIAVCQAEAQAVHVYDFNRTSGVPTLAIDTGNIDAVQDVEFSPDGKLVYYCWGRVVDGTGGGHYGLRQMDLNSLQVRTLRDTSAALLTKPYDLQLGPDDKLYIARPGQPSLDVVVLPNAFKSSDASNDCGYIANAVSLGAGVFVNQSGALPNTLSMCAAYVPPAAFTYTQTNCRTFTFTTANCPPYDWDFGDGTTVLNWTFPSIIHVYAPNATGPFNVKLIATNASPTTVIKPVSVQALPVSIIGPGSACGGPLNYTANGPSGYTYQWTITGGSPPTATGNNVFVNWGLGSTQSILLTATDPKTGCQSTSILTVDPCANCSAPPLDMIAWWPLDETGAGSTAQEIVGAHDAVDVNTTRVPCAVQYGRSFNATSSYLHASHDPKLNLGTGNLTLDAWIRTTSNPTSMGIVEKRSLSPNLGYAMYLKNGNLAMSLGDGTASAEFVATSNVNLIDGLWHHVAVTEDRGNGAAGTTLYIDGMPVTVLPAFAGNFSIDNTEKLLIGAQEPSANPTGFWSGQIDEVEIFDRALTGEEIAKIYGSGAGGKCKEFVYAPLGQTLCSEAPFGDVTFSICNYTGASQNYKLSFLALNGAAGCNVPGPASFTILSPNTNGVVSAGTGCTAFLVRVFKPSSGMNNGDKSCYQITATNQSNNVSHTSNATITANSAVCPRLTSAPLTSVGVGVAVPHTFQIQNTSISPQVVNVQVNAIGVDQPVLVGGGAVSLNGQPPGAPWFTTYVLSPGESTQVHVDAQFTDAAPFIPYDILLSTDINGDGISDAEAAAGMINSEPPLHVVAVRPPASDALPTRFDLVSAAPNPFHRLIAVEFALPRASAVKLEMFDVSGRRVRGSVEAAPAGRSLRMLDARGLHSGVYLLRFEAGGVVRTRRMVMLRD